MNMDRIEGKAKELKGRAKQSVGKHTGGDRMAASGAKDELKGDVQQGWGELKDAVKGDKHKH